MKKIRAFDPSLYTDTHIATAQASAGAKLYLINESFYGLELVLGAGQTLILPAWYALLISFKFATPSIEWSISYQLTLDSTSLPNSLVLGFSFDATEDTSSYKSGPLVRQLAVGNGVNLGGGGISGGGTVSVASALQNDLSGGVTQVFETTVLGSGGSSWNFNNDGTGSLRVWTGSAFHTVITTSSTPNYLKLGQAGDSVEVVGSLTIDQNASVTGTFQVTGATTLSNTLAVSGNATFAGQVTASNIVLTGVGNSITSTQLTITSNVQAAIWLTQGGLKAAGSIVIANGSFYQIFKTTTGSINVMYLDNTNTLNLKTGAGTSMALSDENGVNYFASSSATFDLTGSATLLKLSAGTGTGIRIGSSTSQAMCYDSSGNLLLTPSSTLGATSNVYLRDGTGFNILTLNTSASLLNAPITCNGVLTIKNSGGVFWNNAGTGSQITYMRRSSSTFTGTTQTITHALGITPQQIFITYLHATVATTFRLSSVTSTQFTVVFGTSGTYTYYWMAVA